MSDAHALPPGFRAGHHTDLEGGTGCTVVLPPAGCVAAAEVRGGGPGTRESDLLSPASHAPGVQALLLTGGSAFGLHAADGVANWLAERDLGHLTPVANVPLVFAAVVFDLPLGDPQARPDAAAGRAACDAAAGAVERGSVGVGTGCTVGKLLGREAWTKGGFGAASFDVDGATVCALAAVNAAGDVVREDGQVLAGVWRDGAFRSTTQLLIEGERPPYPIVGEATTLVCVLTDAGVSKLEAWKIARAATSGVGRAVAPSATAVDGDLVACVAGGEADADPLVLEAVAAEAAAAAIRDAVRQATSLAGCPSARDRLAASE
jgi:L-aminopeptidase/D-esterase-like protein